MNWKKLGKHILLPPSGVLMLLLPVSVGLLLNTMTSLPETAPVRIASYVLAFYTLTIWCIRIPAIILRLRKLKNENRYILRWRTDPRLRTNVTLVGHVLWNGAYAALQLALGICHKSPWYFSLSAYYGALAIMRLFLVQHTLRYQPGEKKRQELRRYLACGWIFLLMNLALSGMLLYMIRENRTPVHHEITTIAMAAYTFASMSLAIVNVLRFRRYHSPAMSAAKAISLAAACVSMLTLENTMLTTFSSSDMAPQTKILFLGLSGCAVFAFIIAMALYMLVQGRKSLKIMEDDNHGKERNL